MAKKTETKTPVEKIEREYVIPLRERLRSVPIYKKTPKAIKTIKEFLVKHMKIYDRDLKKIKIDKYLNEFIWDRGIKNPVHKVKVKAIKEGEIVRVELVEIPERLKFKKLREEKREQKSKEVLDGKKKVLEKKTEEKPKEETAEKIEEKKVEEKEKKASVVEAGKEIEKAAAKQMKHQVGGKEKAPKIKRVALKK
ncbi:MAG: 50S ribosomal protein L31e [Nanoarchaeota archaeon]|nr:50S ribosomal protein L31e [Nanoarchaeota archaeon]